jgi:hypothetical protein
LLYIVNGLRGSTVKCESLDYLNFTVTLVRADDLDSRVEMALDQ